MVNTIGQHIKTGTSKVIKAVTMLGTTILITLAVHANPTSAAVQKEIAEIFKKNPDKEIVVKVENDNQSTDNVEKFESLGNDTINALTFATQNVDKYYPDMKEHLTTMMNSFRDEEHQGATIKLLDEMVVNITDPAQKTGAIIYALEGIFYKGVFAKKYDSEITDETFVYIEIFDTDYKTRFKGYYERLEEQTKQLQEELIKKQEKLKQLQEELEQSKKELEQSKKELEQSKKEFRESLEEFEQTLSKFSPEDVKNNAGIKKLTLETKQFYENLKKQKFYEEGGFSISSHLQSLFDAVQ